MAYARPQPMSTGTDVEPVARAGRNELGTISIADGVVSKIAARAAAENPDAGAAAVRMLGRVVPGAGHLGVRGTDLQALRSEEHTSELQSLTNLVCRLLLEKKHKRRKSEIPGGQKMSLLLAQALFGDPQARLLDEPTNPLDLDSIHWLKAFFF